MSERYITSDHELVNDDVRRRALRQGGREVILSVINDAMSIGEVTRPVGGQSSRTAERILVTTRSGTQPVVLKRFPADPDRAAAEWRAPRAVEHLAVPSPPPLFLDHDGADVGAPAIVIGALAGTVLRGVLRSGTWLRNATATMARLHAIEPTTVPADIPAWPRLLDRWTPDGLPPALGGAAAKAIAELRCRARTARRALCHGDFNLGNLLFAGHALTGIVDWERAKVMPADNEVAHFRMDRAIHPGGGAPCVFLNTYLQETAASAVEDLALRDVLAGTVGLASAQHSREGLEDIGVSLDTATVARRATSFLENALARCCPRWHRSVAGPGEPSPERSPDGNGAAPSPETHKPRPGRDRRSEPVNGRSARYGKRLHHPADVATCRSRVGGRSACP